MYRLTRREREKAEEARTKRFFGIFAMILVIALVVSMFFFGSKIFGKIGFDINDFPYSDIIEVEDMPSGDVLNKDKNLNIFNNPEFEGKPLIYPSAKGSYDFVIHNKTKSLIEANLYLNDTNLHKINMKYRVKINDVYYFGDNNTWVSMEEITNNEEIYILIPLQSNTRITLDWHWQDADNDSEIGLKPRAEYILSVKVIASKVVS